MRFFIFIFSILFAVGCQIDPDSKQEDSTVETIPNPASNLTNTHQDYQDIIMHSDLDTMLTMIGSSLMDKDYRGSFKYIDPLQMAIQSEEIEMDSCQNIAELIHLKKASFNTHCELLSNILYVNFTGFKREGEETYHVIGKAKLSDNTEQEISFQINILAKNMFVISGAVG